MESEVAPQNLVLEIEVAHRILAKLWCPDLLLENEVTHRSLVLENEVAHPILAGTCLDLKNGNFLKFSSYMACVSSSIVAHSAAEQAKTITL